MNTMIAHINGVDVGRGEKTGTDVPVPVFRRYFEVRSRWIANFTRPATSWMSSLRMRLAR